MDQHPDGLNFVPRLVRDSSPPPPTSSRSRISLTPKISQGSLVYYNGNYEGDITMFRERNSLMSLEHFSLVETDSESEMKKDMELYKEPNAAKASKETQLWLFMQHCLLYFLKPETVMKITQYVDNFLKSKFYSRLKLFGKYYKIALLWTIRVFIVLCSKLEVITVVLWKLRTFLRNIIRRLLWWLTLAKCGDLTLFSVVLLCTPVLFLIAAMGFFISLYSYLKDYIQRWVGLLRIRMF